MYARAHIHTHKSLDLQGMVTGGAMGWIPTPAGREVEVEVDVGTPGIGARTGFMTEIMIMILAGTEIGVQIQIGTGTATIATPHRCVGCECGCERECNLLKMLYGYAMNTYAYNMFFYSYAYTFV